VVRTSTAWSKYIVSAFIGSCFSLSLLAFFLSSFLAQFLRSLCLSFCVLLLFLIDLSCWSVRECICGFWWVAFSLERPQCVWVELVFFECVLTFPSGESFAVPLISFSMITNGEPCCWGIEGFVSHDWR
jgi:hypothetical protein